MAPGLIGDLQLGDFFTIAELEGCAPVEQVIPCRSLGLKK